MDSNLKWAEGDPGDGHAVRKQYSEQTCTKLGNLRIPLWYKPHIRLQLCSHRNAHIGISSQFRFYSQYPNNIIFGSRIYMYNPNLWKVTGVDFYQ